MEDALKTGALMGGAFGGVKSAVLGKGVKQGIKRFVLGAMALDIARDTRPWDQRKFDEKFAAYTLDAFFLMKGYPEPQRALMIRKMSDIVKGKGTMTEAEFSKLAQAEGPLQVAEIVNMVRKGKIKPKPNVTFKDTPKPKPKPKGKVKKLEAPKTKELEAPQAKIGFEKGVPEAGRKGEGFTVGVDLADTIVDTALPPEGVPFKAETELRKSYPKGAEFVAGKEQDVDIEYTPIGKRISKNGVVIPWKKKSYADIEIPKEAKRQGISAKEFTAVPYRGGYVIQRTGAQSIATQHEAIRNGRTDKELKQIIFKARKAGTPEAKIQELPEAQVLTAINKFPKRRKRKFPVQEGRVSPKAPWRKRLEKGQ